MLSRFIPIIHTTIQPTPHIHTDTLIAAMVMDTTMAVRGRSFCLRSRSTSADGLLSITASGAMVGFSPMAASPGAGLPSSAIQGVLVDAREAAASRTPPLAGTHPGSVATVAAAFTAGADLAAIQGAIPAEDGRAERLREGRGVSLGPRTEVENK